MRVAGQIGRISGWPVFRHSVSASNWLLISAACLPERLSSQTMALRSGRPARPPESVFRPGSKMRWPRPRRWRGALADQTADHPPYALPIDFRIEFAAVRRRIVERVFTSRGADQPSVDADEDSFDRGRTYVDSDEISAFHDSMTRTLSSLATCFTAATWSP